MCCGQSASADCLNAKQRWLRQVKSAERTFELRTPHIFFLIKLIGFYQFLLCRNYYNLILSLKQTIPY